MFILARILRVFHMANGNSAVLSLLKLRNNVLGIIFNIHSFAASAFLRCTEPSWLRRHG